MIKAYGYLRVSGKSQLDGDGFERQRIAIKSHAKRNDMKVVRWFEEAGVSGKTEWDDRPAWAEMITELNGIQTIIIERLDRLARDLMVQEHIIADLRHRRIDLISTEEPDLGSDEPSRILMRQIMGAIAQYDRTMIVRKMAGARRRIRDAGEKCEGRKVYGVREGEMVVLARMISQRAAGVSFAGIANSLNDAGIMTRYGRQWSPQTVCKILTRDLKASPDPTT